MHGEFRAAHLAAFLGREDERAPVESFCGGVDF
jgi:hypothetical protein